MRRVALTTLDNPYSPFDDFREWYEFDQQHGYGTTSYLARIVMITRELEEVLENEAIELAIDEIVAFNLIGLYVKLVREEEPALD